MAAALAVGSAVVHSLLAATGQFEAVAMAAMALICLSCAWHLWRAPTGRIWTVTAIMDAGMLALHTRMLLQHGDDPASMGAGTSPSLSAGMHASGGDMTHPHVTLLMVLGFVLVAGQLCVAASALLRPPVTPTGHDLERAPSVSDDVSPRRQWRESVTYRTGELS